MNTTIPTICFACILMIYCTGCGNQMMRQPSFSPLDSPRSAPATTAVELDPNITPSDGHPIASANAGNKRFGADEVNQISMPDATLPPPNLSDNAANLPIPTTVNSIQNPLAMSSQVISDGHTIFLNRCVQCHNSSGYGYGPVGAYLIPHPVDLASKTAQQKSDGALFWVITMGQGKMPGFRDWTSSYERWELTNYVRSLKDRKIRIKLSDTLTAPYPVYGTPGFEVGNFTSPHRVLPSNSQAEKSSRQRHFEQSDQGAWQGVE